MTLVVTRQAEGDWRLAAFQNTRLRVMGAGARPFLLWTLTDWLWKAFRRNGPRA
jgi:hypothetical protein